MAYQWYTLRQDYIDTFKQQWPCHNLPDNLESLHFQFDADGDLVDIEAYININGESVQTDSSEFDGPALVALSEDSRKHGDIS